MVCIDDKSMTALYTNVTHDVDLLSKPGRQMYTTQLPKICLPVSGKCISGYTEHVKTGGFFV